MKPQIIIPIYHPDRRFLLLLRSIKNQTIDVPVLLIDSGPGVSYDDDIANMNVQVRKIDDSEFNHGGTRQMGIEMYPEADVYVFLTQDAILVNDYAIEKLLAVFHERQIGCAYGRQIPHKGAGIFGEIAREINYPEKSHAYALADRKHHGVKTAFISNSFAAYRKEAMQQIGGFPQDTILSEDMYVAAKMLLAEWKVAYAANAMVYHSHDYTLFQEFRRYFDIGVFHARESWIQKEFGKAEGEGKRFIVAELKYILSHCPYRFPEMILRDGMKFLGYRLGLREHNLKRSWKKKLSMFPKYWDCPTA